MTIITLTAEVRKDIGKGASRRLRRLHNRVPAVIYGGDKEAQSIDLPLNKVKQALEIESIYSSIFDLQIGDQVEHVILKALQRHPYKPTILHMDLQRVSQKDILIKQVPIHFINEAISKGVKAGGKVTHNMNQVEIRCQAKDLPEFIEVDLAKVELNQALHLSNLKLPKGVQLTAKIHDASDDLPVVSIHSLKGGTVEEVAPAPSEDQETESNE